MGTGTLMVKFIETILYGDLSTVFFGICIASFIITGLDLLARLISDYPIGIVEVIYCCIKGISFEDYYNRK